MPPKSLVDQYQAKKDVFYTNSKLLKEYRIDEQPDISPRELGAIKGRTTESINWLIEHDTTHTLISDALTTQRHSAEAMGLEHFPHYSSYELWNSMGQRDSDVFYQLQRTFSRPEDYYEKPSNYEKKKHDYIDALVIDPDRVSDDQLIRLGLMSEESRLPADIHTMELSERTKIRDVHIAKKIALLPKLKALIASADPLPMEIAGKETGRVLRARNGRYFVFQDRSLATNRPRRTQTNSTLLTYSDIYALKRGHDHAIQKMRDDITFIEQEILPEIQGDVQIYWKRLSPGTRQGVVRAMMDLLASRTSPLFKRAYSRLSKMDTDNALSASTANHPEQSAKLLEGVLNDLRSHSARQKSRIKSIKRQSQQILSTILGQESSQTTYINELENILSTVNTRVLDRHIRLGAGETAKKLSRNQRSILDAALHATREYVDHCIESDSRILVDANGKRQRNTDYQPIGEPFLSFYRRLDHILKEPIKTDTDIIRIVLRLQIAARRQLYRMALYKTRHDIRDGLRPQVMTEEYITQVQDRIDTTLMLPSDRIGSRSVGEIEKMRKQVREVLDLVRGAPDEYTVEYIDSSL